MARSVPQGTERALFASSGGRCARCFRRIIEGQETSDDISVIGEIAHIRGKKSGSPRYDSNMSDYERDRYDNLIVLCANCHKIVDDQPGTYTVAKLQTLKRTHEEKIVRIICRGVPDVMFNELEMVTKYIVSGQAADEGTYELVTPKEKIRKKRSVCVRRGHDQDGDGKGDGSAQVCQRATRHAIRHEAEGWIRL